MVIYEVNITVQEPIAAQYEGWLEGHIREILRLDGFLDASWFRDSGSTPGERRLVVHYRLRDRAALDSYLAEHAPRMRRDGTERFADGFTATRRILELVADMRGESASL